MSEKLLTKSLSFATTARCFRVPNSYSNNRVSEMPYKYSNVVSVKRLRPIEIKRANTLYHSKGHKAKYVQVYVYIIYDHIF